MIVFSNLIFASAPLSWGSKQYSSRKVSHCPRSCNYIYVCSFKKKGTTYHDRKPPSLPAAQFENRMSTERAHLHTHLSVRWMTSPSPSVTLLWARLKHREVDFTLSSPLRCSSAALSSSFISGAGSISPLEDDQSGADRSEIMPCGAEKEIGPYYLSSWKI